MKLVGSSVRSDWWRPTGELAVAAHTDRSLISGCRSAMQDRLARLALSVQFQTGSASSQTENWRIHSLHCCHRYTSNRHAGNLFVINQKLDCFLFHVADSFTYAASLHSLSLLYFTHARQIYSIWLHTTAVSAKWVQQFFLSRYTITQQQCAETAKHAWTFHSHVSPFRFSFSKHD